MSSKKSNKINTIKSIHIGGSTIEILYDDHLSEFGCYQSYPHPTITIGQQSQSVLAGTILHESLHAISDLYELDLSEHQVRVLEQCLVSLLRQNPVVAGMLIKSTNTK